MSRTEIPLTVGHRADQILGAEYVKEKALKRQRAIEQHRSQSRVRRARFLHMKRLIG